MKKLSIILRTAVSVIVAIIALAMMIIEAILLFTGDFLLFEGAFLAFVQILLRLLVAGSAFATALFAIIKLKRRFLFEAMCLLGATAAMLPFITNGFGLYFLLLAAVFASSCLLDWFVNK